jgi:hypothetical protein
MNNEHFIFGDVMYRKNKNPNEPIHLFITRGVSRGKTFTLMLLIQVLILFLIDVLIHTLLKKKFCSWHIPEKQHLTLMEL